MTPGVTIVIHSSDLATTILASLGTVLAMLSLAWQAWSFVLSGSRVHVEVGDGLRGLNHVARIARNATATEIASLQAQGLNERVLSVCVNNTGRGSTSVVSVRLVFEDGGGVSESLLDPPLDHKLEGESEQVWYFDVGLAQSYVKAMSRTLHRPYTVRGHVRLGGRDNEIVSKNEIEVPDM